MSRELNILWMYPDILNLHGDRGNLMAFERICNKLDIKANITRVERYDDKIDFENNDIMFFNVGEIRVMPAIIDVLKKNINEVTKFVEDNKTVILIGASGCIMAKKTIRKDSEFEGLGFLDMELCEMQNIYGDDILFTLSENGMTIAGCQIKMLKTRLLSDIALGTLEYGSGNAGYEAKAEGAKYKNVIYTNALGPVFVKNPWYAQHIIKNAMKNKNLEISETLTDEDFELELASLTEIKKFIDNKGVKDVSGN